MDNWKLGPYKSSIPSGYPYEPAKNLSNWDDLLYPFVGRNIDTSSGRIDYNYVDLGISFQTNARYHVNEQISIISQIPHDWKQGTILRPHIHWYQQNNNNPNWLMEYRWYNNGQIVPTEWTQVTLEAHLFTWTTGKILQISRFPNINPTGISGVSSILDIKFFRDTQNATGKFAGAESGHVIETVKELDIHYLRDNIGSRQEYIK